MSHTRKYLPLLRYLGTLPPNQDTVRLQYADIEALLGFPLPIGAWLPHFWSGGRTAQTNWRANGFNAALDRSAQSVLFTRQASCSAPRGDEQSAVQALGGARR